MAVAVNDRLVCEQVAVYDGESLGDVGKGIDSKFMPPGSLPADLCGHEFETDRCATILVRLGFSWLTTRAIGKQVPGADRRARQHTGAAVPPRRCTIHIARCAPQRVASCRDRRRPATSLPWPAQGHSSAQAECGAQGQGKRRAPAAQEIQSPAPC